MRAVHVDKLRDLTRECSTAILIDVTIEWGKSNEVL